MSINSRPEEISSIIKEQINNYRSRLEMKETGTVILVGDGIARVYGLRECMASELLEFEDGILHRTSRMKRFPLLSSPTKTISAKVQPYIEPERSYPFLLVKSFLDVL